VIAIIILLLFIAVPIWAVVLGIAAASSDSAKAEAREKATRLVLTPIAIVLPLWLVGQGFRLAEKAGCLLLPEEDRSSVSKCK
jgi:spore maturation protein SpmA